MQGKTIPILRVIALIGRHFGERRDRPTTGRVLPAQVATPFPRVRQQVKSSLALNRLNSNRCLRSIAWDRPAQVAAPAMDPTAHTVERDD